MHILNTSWPPSIPWNRFRRYGSRSIFERNKRILITRQRFECLITYTIEYRKKPGHTCRGKHVKLRTFELSKRHVCEKYCDTTKKCSHYSMKGKRCTLFKRCRKVKPSPGEDIYARPKVLDPIEPPCMYTFES